MDHYFLDAKMVLTTGGWESIIKEAGFDFQTEHVARVNNYRFTMSKNGQIFFSLEMSEGDLLQARKCPIAADLMPSKKQILLAQMTRTGAMEAVRRGLLPNISIQITKG